MATLARRLGYDDHAKLVIISCDDLGACHAANVGVYGALRDGIATCASIMVPAPWARDAALRYEPGDDIGVHLTLNCEYEAYRFGPITHAPSLHSGEAGFPRRIADLWEHADPEEVLRECRAQIERAIAWGIDATHLTPHLTAITLRPEFFDIYLELAVEFRLPIRLPSTITSDQAGFPFRHLAEEEGVSSRITSTTIGEPAVASGCTKRSARCNPASPRSMCSRPSTHPRCAPSPTPHLVGSTTTRWSPTTRSFEVAVRERRGADRLPTAQGRDASRLIAAPASPLRSTSNSAAVDPSTSTCPA
jgi:predicted glycoside hydrolase/deacetylase ChbG (UPF0249 family)